MRATALILTFLMSVAVSAQEPVTGYAPVNGLKMYYEIYGKGDPVVLLHGSFMTITNNWTDMVARLSKSRQVIAVEMQGHGRTADIDRDFSYENLADDIAALLGHLKLEKADVLGYSMGGGVALQVAIRHPEKVRKVVSISAVFRHDGWVKEAVEMFPRMEAGMFKGSFIETEYKKLSPTPGKFETFVMRVIQMDIKPYDFGAEKLKATKAPMLFIHGDADGVRLDHISEMFRLKGDEIFGDYAATLGIEARDPARYDAHHVDGQAGCHRSHGPRFSGCRAAEIDRDEPCSVRCARSLRISLAGSVREDEAVAGVGAEGFDLLAVGPGER